MQRILLRGMHPIVGLLRSAVSVQATHWLIDNFNFVLGINGHVLNAWHFFDGSSKILFEQNQRKVLALRAEPAWAT